MGSLCFSSGLLVGSLCFSQVEWWVPCVYPNKMVGSFFFPRKRGPSEERKLMKFKCFFFAGTFWGPRCYSTNSAANRDLNNTFFLESLGGTRAGRWKTTYLEKSHHIAGSAASENSPLSEGSIVLEHVTPWVTRPRAFSQMKWFGLWLSKWTREGRGGVFELGRVNCRPLFLFVFNRNRGRKWTLPS